MAAERSDIKADTIPAEDRGETVSLMEPLLIGFLGVTIGSIVIAMYLPLFTLIGKLSQGH